jgi:cyanophycinase
VRASASTPRAEQSGSLTSQKPIYALADSLPLFLGRSDGSSLLDEIARNTGVQRPTIAYVGASNRDSLEAYHLLFEPGIETAGFGEHRMILSRPAQDDAKFLERAEIILLAGGDVHTGWRVFEENGLRELIPRRFREGVLLMGVSAGAVQLGCGTLSEGGYSILATFGLLPLYVGVHGEQENWSSLRRIAGLCGERSHAIGIPRSSGIRYENGELEILRGSVFELLTEGGQYRESTIFPETSSL